MLYLLATLVFADPKCPETSEALAEQRESFERMRSHSAEELAELKEREGTPRLVGHFRLGKDRLYKRPGADHPIKTVNQRVAIIDIGSNTVKLYSLEPGGSIQVAQKKIDLGGDIGRTGSISEENERALEETLEKMIRDLYPIHPEDIKIMATASLRDSKNGKEVAARLKEKAGIPIEILSEHRESELVYRAVISTNEKAVAQGAVVVEVGGGSTEFVVGTIKHGAESIDSVTLPIGSSRLTFKNPFDAAEVSKAKEKVRPLIKGVPETKQEVLIGRSTIYEKLRELHLKLTGEDLFETGLSISLMEHYLSEKGLSLLREADKSSPNDPVFQSVPGKLVIISQLLKAIGAEKISFGAKGGMKAAALAELVVDRVEDEISENTAVLMLVYKKHIEEAVQQLHEVFPTRHFGKLIYRPKEKSIADKLRVKAFGKNKPISLPEQAMVNVGDGIGSRLILSDTSPGGIQTFVDSLSLAIRDGRLWVSEIQNLQGPRGKPYLSDVQIAQLKKAFEESTQKDQYTFQVVSGADAIRKGGYTSLHLNILHKNGLEGELQVRGAKINVLAEAEHLLYDARQGKEVASSHFSPEVAKIRSTYRNLEPGLMDSYSNYLRDLWIAARRAELGEVTGTPELPKELSHLPELAMENIQSALALPSPAPSPNGVEDGPRRGKLISELLKRFSGARKTPLTRAPWKPLQKDDELNADWMNVLSEHRRVLDKVVAHMNKILGFPMPFPSAVQNPALFRLSLSGSYVDGEPLKVESLNRLYRAMIAMDRDVRLTVNTLSQMHFKPEARKMMDEALELLRWLKELRGE